MSTLILGMYSNVLRIVHYNYTALFFIVFSEAFSFYSISFEDFNDLIECLKMFKMKMNVIL